MHVKVCHGCPLRLTRIAGRLTQKRCEILQAKLDGVRGLGLKAISFDCPTKLELFKPGQGVTFQGATHNDYYGQTYDDFNGFVFGWKNGKVRIVSEETEKPFVKVYPSRLTLTGETRRVCVHCGMPEGVKVTVKMPSDPEPRPWVCRDDGDYEREAGPKVLPCEYGKGGRDGE